ncbi:MAG: hypothetical protein HFG98_06595 [Dorea sp.]|nr:hypothetical protein [Dorea sp.]
MKNIKIVAAAAFAAIALLIPSITASAESVGETVSRNTTAELRAVQYENNETIGALLAPSSYSATEKLNKKTEIFKRDGTPYDQISDEQVIKELNQDNVKVMSFEDSFAEVQAEIDIFIQKIIDNPNNPQIGADSYKNKILQNKEKLLLGLTYLNRLYDFEMDGHNFRDALLCESKPYRYITYYGFIDNVPDWLIYIGGTGGDKLKISKSASAFGSGSPFYPITTATSLDAFLEEYRKKWIPNTSMDEWFLQESPAFIAENRSSWDQKNTGIYRRLYDNPEFRSYILPLLTVSEDSIYMIANSATITFGIVDCYIDRNLKTNPVRYGELREKFRQQMKQAAKQQSAFIDFWHRIATPEQKGKFSSNRVVLDSLRIDSGAAVQWSDKFGKNASQGVREFITPLNLYDSYMFADGVAEGSGIRYYLSKALTERGLATYAHELTHILVSEAMLNGYGSRDGMLAEVYPRGLFEPYELNDPPAFNLNLIYDRLAVSDRYHNGQPERFQSEADLKDYMSGILDVVYTLDYAEADVILAKTPEEKKKWFHKLEQIEDPEARDNKGQKTTGHNLDLIKELTLEEAKNLNTIDDLIRGNIIASRYEVDGTKTTGTVTKNGYYVVPLFSANYAGVQNDKGVSGDITIRRHAFELLAEYGYYGGMVPYISNQYKGAAAGDNTILSDKYILNKISDGTYKTMADFKKAMFQRRIEKTRQLKPVTITWKNQSVTINNFEKLLLLMKEAVESDLINVTAKPDGSNNIRAHSTQAELLKQQIFKAYLLETNDFSNTIYGDPSPVDPPSPDVTEPDQPGNSGNSGTTTPENPDTGTTTPVNPDTGTGTPGTGTAKPNTGASTAAVTPKLLLCKVSAAKTSHTIRWNAVGSADGYDIYGAKSNGKYERIQTVSKNSVKWTHKKLKKGKLYKYYVQAYQEIGGKRIVIAKSLDVYSTTKGGKYGNASKVSAKKTRISVKAGKKAKLSAKAAGKKLNKTAKKMRYVSSNPSVAKVSSKGIITGKKRGSCTVYCIARNGVYKKIKVTTK